MHMRLQTDVSAVQLNSERAGFTMVFPAPNMLAQIHSNMASTLNIDWLLDVGRGLLKEHGIDRSRGDMLKGMDEKLLARAPAAVLFHPYISKAGEDAAPSWRPVPAPCWAQTRAQIIFGMMRAVFEGLGLASRDCYSAMGAIPSEVRITGGAARSGALRSILASILNARIRSVAREEAGAAGAAMTAAVQQKIYPDMTACTNAWVEPHSRPSPSRKGVG